MKQSLSCLSISILLECNLSVLRSATRRWWSIHFQPDQLNVSCLISQFWLHFRFQNRKKLLMFDVIPAQLCTYQANPTRHSSQRCWCPHRWQILEVVPAENRIRFLVLDCTRALHLSPIFREVSWYKRWSDLRYIYYKYSALKDVNFLVKTKIHTSIHFIPCILYPVMSGSILLYNQDWRSHLWQNLLQIIL